MGEEQKPPIIDRTDQAAMLKACDGVNEFVPIWLMLRLGVPPQELQGNGITFNNDHVYWLRPYRKIPRSAQIGDRRLMKKVAKWIAHGRKYDLRYYQVLISKIGARIGHPEYSYQTLLNSSTVNQIREGLDEGLSLDTTVNMVAERMGRTVDKVKNLYLEFEKWREAGGEDTEASRLAYRRGSIEPGKR
jgi:hypothetical protein